MKMSEWNFGEKKISLTLVNGFSMLWERNIV